MKKKFVSFLMAGCICCTSLAMLSTADTPAHALTIIASVTKVSVFKDTIAVGENAQLELEWSNGAKQTIYYSSSDESVAAVDQNGLVTGISDGTAVITVSHSNSGKDKTITITVSSDVEKSTVYNTSELTLGTKLRKYDTLHYDNKNKGSVANIINAKGSYDLAFINESDYVLPFDAELVGIDVLTLYLAPENLEGVTYLDGRTLKAGDTVDTNTHLLCYDYLIKNASKSTLYTLPVFLPKYYEEYIGNGKIQVSKIDHENKTIELESVPVDIQMSKPLYVTITSEPFDTVIHGNDELDLTGLKLTIGETDGNGNETSLLKDVTIDEAKEKYDVLTEIKSEAPGGGICVITVTKKNTEISDSASFNVAYGAPVVKGDLNADGEFDILDVQLLRQWLLTGSDTYLADCLTNWQRADMHRDGRLDVFDLCLMKRELNKKNKIASEYGVTAIGYSDELLKLSKSDSSSAIITSAEELKSYLTPITIQDNVDSYMNRFNDSFFENNVLLLNALYQPSTAEIYAVDSVSYKGDKLVVNYSLTYKGLGADIVNGFLAEVVIPKENYHAKSVEWKLTEIDVYGIKSGYIAVFHGKDDDIIHETYIYKIDNGAANYGFEYINVERRSGDGYWVPETTTVTGQGNIMWTDGVFMVAEENNAYEYVTVPGNDLVYSIEEFMEIFLMN